MDAARITATWLTLMLTGTLAGCADTPCSSWYCPLPPAPPAATPTVSMVPAASPGVATAPALPPPASWQPAIDYFPRTTAGSTITAASDQNSVRRVQAAQLTATGVRERRLESAMPRPKPAVMPAIQGPTAPTPLVPSPIP